MIRPPIFQKVIEKETSSAEVTGSSLYFEVTKGNTDFVQDQVKLGADGKTLDECKEKMTWLITAAKEYSEVVFNGKTKERIQDTEKW